MNLNIKLKNDKHCNDCPCLVHGAVNWICKHYNRILLTDISSEITIINRLTICKKENKNKVTPLTTPSN